MQPLYWQYQACHSRLTLVQYYGAGSWVLESSNWFGGFGECVTIFLRNRLNRLKDYDKIRMSSKNDGEYYNSKQNMHLVLAMLDGASGSVGTGR